MLGDKSTGGESSKDNCRITNPMEDPRNVLNLSSNIHGTKRPSPYLHIIAHEEIDQLSVPMMI